MPGLAVELDAERARSKELKSERFRAAEALTEALCDAREARALLFEVVGRLPLGDLRVRIDRYLERTDLRE